MLTTLIDEILDYIEYKKKFDHHRNTDATCPHKWNVIRYPGKEMDDVTNEKKCDDLIELDRRKNWLNDRYDSLHGILDIFKRS